VSGSENLRWLTDLRDIHEELQESGRLPVNAIDWTHPKEQTFAQWKERAEKKYHPDEAIILRGERCTECGGRIPLAVFAFKEKVLLDSWGAVLVGEDLICDECSPI